jgi:phosphotransferase family enzyme
MPEPLVAVRSASGRPSAGRAVRAWRAFRGEQGEPIRVDILQDSLKASVYRLGAAGPGGTAVIAKRTCGPGFLTECQVYEQLLPRLPVSQVRYYGCLEEVDACGWIFLEDMGGKPYSHAEPTHRALAAEWLGLLHRTAAVNDMQQLHDRGPDHYLEHLRAGRRLILRHLGDTGLSVGDVAVLHDIAVQCDLVESRWADLVEICVGMPRTLVHGDFNPKNAQVRTNYPVQCFLIVDWEMAGLGVPAVDLTFLTSTGVGTPDLNVYTSLMRVTWTTLTLADVRRMSQVGAIFRLLAAIEWNSMGLPFPSGRDTVPDFRLYRSTMNASIRRLGWKR